MQTDQEKRDQLETINEVLAGGITEDSSDGQATKVSHETLRQERTRLERELGIDDGTTVFRFGRGNA